MLLRFETKIDAMIWARTIWAQQLYYVNGLLRRRPRLWQDTKLGDSFHGSRDNPYIEYIGVLEGFDPRKDRKEHNGEVNEDSICHTMVLM